MNDRERDRATKVREALAAALMEAGLPDMSDAAARGHYSDFSSPLDAPKMTLAGELAAVGTQAAQALRKRVIGGAFDG